MCPYRQLPILPARSRQGDYRVESLVESRLPADAGGDRSSVWRWSVAGEPFPSRRGAQPRARWRPLLRGRRRECELLDAQLQRIAVGQSSVLVLRGEPGVGKSALLEYLVEQASGCRIVRAVGVQSEMELAYAGLHQLCAGMLDRLAGLPGPQRDALRVAFGLQEGGAPEPFAVAVAVLSVLSEAAEAKPLVC